MSGVRVERHESITDLEPEWNQLAARTGAAPFLHPGWLASWWKAFGRGHLVVLAARIDGELDAVLPLARRGALLSPTNWHTPLYGAISASENASQALANALVDEADAHVRLRFFDRDDPFLEALAGAIEDAGWTAAKREMQRSPYIPIEGAWGDFQRGLPRRLRGNIARRERRLAQLGELAFAVEDGSDRLDKLLDDGFALEASGWKGKKGTAIASRPETRAFYTELSRWAASIGILRLGFVRLDGRAIAFSLDLQHRGVHYVLKPGYSEEMARYGPGALLTYRMIERAFADDLSSYEFLGEADDFKRSFAGERLRVRVEAQAFARSARGIAKRLVQTRGRSAARRLLVPRR